jgi:hypothetical protein
LYFSIQFYQMQRNSLQIIRLIALLSLMFWQSSFAQIANPQSKIVSIYDSIRQNMPREKLYVHFDKSIYAPKDTIWFKSYLVDASLNKYSKLSGLVYFDVFDSNGAMIQSLALPTNMGIAWGGIALNPDIYKTGTYTFRAYTNWMQNFGNTYLFKKEIKVLDFMTEEKIYQKDKKTSITSKKTPTATIERIKDIDIQFLPEGGTWLAGKIGKMAFKAILPNGKGVKISGEIMDSKQNKIIDFQSNEKGMGYFEMRPSADEDYSASVKFNDLVKKQNLPKAQLTGSSLRIKNDFLSDSIGVEIFANLPNQEISMIGQSRGILCFHAKFSSNKKYKTVYVSKALFPTGVCQILLINGGNKVLNERNFFINHGDNLKIQTSSLKSSYTTRDSIAIGLKVCDFEGKPLTASFSIAVTDDNQVNKDSINDNNILTQFLLSADLKGEIEDPGYYFHQFDEQKNKDLEALTLTQGWVSYNWDLAKKPLFKAEKEYSISGIVTNLLNKPVAKAKITLMGRNKGLMLLDTIANNNGEFIFDKLPAMDSASFVIQAKNSKNKNGTLGIALNEFKRPPFLITPKNRRYDYEQPLDSIAEQFIATKNQEYEMAFKSGIVLREVKIVAKRIIKDSKNLNGPGESDQAFTETDLNKVAKKSLLQVLEESVKGFSAGYKKGVRGFFINGVALKLIIDGTEVDFFYSPITGANDEYFQFIKSYMDYYNAEDIKGIEVMRSLKYYASYMSRYDNPISDIELNYIEVTTRSGQGPFLKKSGNLYLHRPMDYGDSKVFYSPKYTIQNKADKKPDYRSTLYWQPNLLTDNNGTGTFSFFSADKKGSYTVWIEGSDMEGNIGFKTMKLEVK